MLLHEERVRSRRMHRDAMHAVPDLRVRIGNVLRTQTAIDRLPGLPAIIAPERARGRDGNEDALRIFRIEQNGVQTHSARARLPFRAGAMFAQTGEFLPGRRRHRSIRKAPRLPPLRRRGSGSLNDGSRCQTRLNSHGCCVPSYHMCVSRARHRKRTCCSRPWACRRAWSSVRPPPARLGPGLPAIIRALDDLPKPGARLRSVDPVRIHRRTLEVINFPAGKMRPVDLPLSRLPSDVRTNAPFRVPTRSHGTPLIGSLHAIVVVDLAQSAEPIGRSRLSLVGASIDDRRRRDVLTDDPHPARLTDERLDSVAAVSMPDRNECSVYFNGITMTRREG